MRDLIFRISRKQNDQAIRNNVDSLVKANILTNVNQSKRNVLYESKELLSILDNI